MRTTAEELYNTFTDPQRIAAFTRGPPRQFEGAKVGGKFAIFDGNVVGEFVKLDAPKQIVQKWRLAQWPAEHFSTLEINLDQNDVDGVTQLRVSWSGVPVGQEDVTKQNWELYYVRSIKQTFGYVPPLFSSCPRPLPLFLYLAFDRCWVIRSSRFKAPSLSSSSSSLFKNPLLTVFLFLAGLVLALFSDRLRDLLPTA